MYIYLDLNDKERLKQVAVSMGIYVPYEYHHSQGNQMYISDHNGNMIVVNSDSWLVDLISKLEQRITALEETIERHGLL